MPGTRFPLKFGKGRLDFAGYAASVSNASQSGFPLQLGTAGLGLIYSPASNTDSAANLPLLLGTASLGYTATAPITPPVITHGTRLPFLLGSARLGSTISSTATTTTKTITGTAYIQGPLTQTITGTAHIQVTTDRAITGTAYIQSAALGQRVYLQDVEFDSTPIGNVFSSSGVYGSWTPVSSSVAFTLSSHTNIGGYGLDGYITVKPTRGGVGIDGVISYATAILNIDIGSLIYFQDTETDVTSISTSIISSSGAYGSWTPVSSSVAFTLSSHANIGGYGLDGYITVKPTRGGVGMDGDLSYHTSILNSPGGAVVIDLSSTVIAGSSSLTCQAFRTRFISSTTITGQGVVICDSQQIVFFPATTIVGDSAFTIPFVVFAFPAPAITIVGQGSVSCVGETTRLFPSTTITGQSNCLVDDYPKPFIEGMGVVTCTPAFFCTITGQGVVTCSTFSTHYLASTTITGQGVVTCSVIAFFFISPTIVGQGVVTCQATHYANLSHTTITGQGVVTCIPYRLVTSPVATITGQGVVTCSGRVTHFVSLTIIGDGAVTCYPTGSFGDIGLLIQGQCSVTCTASRVRYVQSTTVTGQGVVACQASARHDVSATITGQGTVMCLPSSIIFILGQSSLICSAESSITIAGQSVVTCQAQAERFRSATITGQSVVTCQASIAHDVSATIVGQSSVLAYTGVFISMIGQGLCFANPYIHWTIVGHGAVTCVVSINWFAGMHITGACSLVLPPTLVLDVAENITGTSTCRFTATLTPLAPDLAFGLLEFDTATNGTGTYNPNASFTADSITVRSGELNQLGRLLSVYGYHIINTVENFERKLLRENTVVDLQRLQLFATVTNFTEIASTDSFTYGGVTVRIGSGGFGAINFKSVTEDNIEHIWVTQIAQEELISPLSKARTTQVAREALVAPLSRARTTQIAQEVLKLANFAAVQQEAVESLANSPPSVREQQVAIEVLASSHIHQIVTQIAEECLSGSTGSTPAGRARVTQVAEELLIQNTEPDNAKALVQQQILEIAALGDPNARVNHEAIEVFGTGLPNARVNQQATEIMGNGLPKARVNQQATEAMINGYPDARLQQVAIEILIHTHLDPTVSSLMNNPRFHV